MSDQDGKNEVSEIETNAAESKQAEIESAEAEDEDEKDEGEKDEKKRDKDKKAAIEFEATLPRSEAVSYFEAIVAGLRAGRIEFRQEGDALVFNVPERVAIEVEAELKGDKGKIVFEIEWSKKTRGLDILS